MNARINHILDEALNLVPDERSAVVVALLDSLQVEDPSTVSAAWVQEIRLRKSELLSSNAQAVSWQQVKARFLTL